MLRILFCFLLVALVEAYQRVLGKKVAVKRPSISDIFSIKWTNENLAPTVISRRRSTKLSGLQSFEGFSQAFVGGTVGVMSVAVILELMKQKEDNYESCPYCMGNGEILCAVCFGTGTASDAQCSCCSGHGLVVCINCKGDGRITPILLQSKAVRDPEYATDGLRKSSVDSP
jgi:hypothetical protein